MRRTGGLSYEPHVDGLRAIAVLSVILYHANPEWLPGGFVGVDIFFVISGYLITKIIVKEIHNKKFSFEGFYKRRIKRILPLFVLVLSTSTIMGFLIYFPKDLEMLVQSGLSSLLFVSNMFFWHQTGYFAPESDVLPLLHTWSLSVEEQFYIFWPPLLLLFLKVMKLKPKALLALVLMGVGVGLVVSEYLLNRNASFGFYSLPSRACELLIGATIAIIHIEKVSHRVGWLLSGLGLVLLFGAFFFITDKMSFPGLNAIYSTLGTAFIIIGGRQNRNGISRMLSTRGFIIVGLLSYSLYLWHWPVFAFARYVILPFTMLNLMALLSLIFILSILSYRFVETPIIRSKMAFKPALTYFFLIPLISYSALFWFVQSEEGLYSRYSVEVQKHMRDIDEIVSEDVHSCLGEHFQLDLRKACVINANTQLESEDIEFNSPSFVLWGDSHANHFRPMLEEMSRGTSLYGRELSFWGCPPFVGLERQGVSFGRTCMQHNKRVLQHILDGNYKQVIIAARWIGYFQSGQMIRDASNRYVFEDPILDSMYHTLKLLNEAGIGVTILKSVPTHPQNPSVCLLKNKLFFNELKSECRLTLDVYNNNNEGVDEVFLELEKLLPEIDVISMAEIFCDDIYCYGERDGMSLYHDKTHLSVSGSKWVAGKLSERGLLKSYFSSGN